MAAEHLLRLDGDLEAEIGEGGLHHRRQQRDEAIGLAAGVLIGMTGGDIHLQRSPDGECATGLGQRPTCQQHLAHVGMFDDRYGATRTVGGTALQALAGVSHGLLVGGLADAQSLNADEQALGIHHREHGVEAAAGFADQPADGAVIVHHAGRLGVNAHLVLQRADRHAVAVSERTVFLDEELGRQEKTDALHALRRVGQAGQHQMHDVAAEIMIARGDEDLRALDGIGTVAHRLCASGEQAEVGAGGGFGERHRARPFARDHLRQICLLQLVACMVGDCLDGTAGQTRKQAEGEIGGR